MLVLTQLWAIPRTNVAQRPEAVGCLTHPHVSWWPQWRTPLSRHRRREHRVHTSLPVPVDSNREVCHDPVPAPPLHVLSRTGCNDRSITRRHPAKGWFSLPRTHAGPPVSPPALWWSLGNVINSDMPLRQDVRKRGSAQARQGTAAGAVGTRSHYRLNFNLNQTPCPMVFHFSCPLKHLLEPSRMCSEAYLSPLPAKAPSHATQCVDLTWVVQHQKFLTQGLWATPPPIPIFLPSIS